MKYNKEYFPKTATIELTNECNLRCIHCYLNKDNPSRLSRTDCIDVINQLSKMGCFRIVFTGGEVFLHKEVLFELLLYAKRLDFKVTVITNLTLCTYDDLDKLKSIGIDSLNASIYGNSEKTYYEVCGKLENALEVKKKILYAKSIGINITLLSAGIQCLFEDLLDIKTWALQHDILMRIAYVIYGKECGEQIANSLTNEQMTELIMMDGDKLIDNINQLKKKREKAVLGFCSSGSHTICIASNGNVYPCANWRMKMGSIYEETILDVWKNSNEIKKIRQYCFLDLKCSKCENFYICPICPGINYSSTGSAKIPSQELCKYADVLNACSQVAHCTYNDN